MVTNEKTWSAGLKAWNERCEAQGLGRGCDTETRDAKLEAILHSGVRGCFSSVYLSAGHASRPPVVVAPWLRVLPCDIGSITELNLE